MKSNQNSRTNEWLQDRLFSLWEEYFNDVPRKNLVLIKFGKKSSRQLGAISWVRKNTRIKKHFDKFKAEHGYQDDPRISLITITGYYKDIAIPDFVIDETIAHEMIHYAHGFHSPLKQIYDHPHKGGIIRKEMQARGLMSIYKKSRKWLKENWREYLKEQ